MSYVRFGSVADSLTEIFHPQNPVSGLGYKADISTLETGQYQRKVWAKQYLLLTLSSQTRINI
jgi:hypothetical protein